MFGPPEGSAITLMENQREDIGQVTTGENEILMAPFMEREVKEAVFQMELNKSPEPDRFLAEFYQVFWEVLKADLLALFIDFHEEKLPLYSLNIGIITLLPKTMEAKHIQQY